MVVHTGAMDEFGALITSLGEHLVVTVGKENLQRVDIFGDESDGSAHIEIVLVDDAWDRMSGAIDKMIEIREMFLDELSIDYRFADQDSETAASANARRSNFVYA